MKQPHQHYADTFPGKSGSAYQGFPRRRKVTAWDVLSTICVAIVGLIIFAIIPGGW